jgi:hypothetical protein
MANAAAKTLETATPPAPSLPRPKPVSRAPKRLPKVAAPAVPAVAAAGKPVKHRVRLVRDSFTMPEADFSLVATLKSRSMAAQRQAKKSELLRAGLHALASLTPAKLVKALDQLEPVKTGRPKKAHAAQK